jgi:hypothetical protein
MVGPYLEKNPRFFLSEAEEKAASRAVRRAVQCTYPECRGCRAPPRRDAGRPAPQCRAAAAAAASAGNPCTPSGSRPPKTCTVRRGVTGRPAPQCRAAAAAAASEGTPCTPSGSRPPKT